MGLGTLFVITGASGVGKGTLIRRLLERVKLYYSVSMTTRPPRSGERHGIDYWFVDRAEFLKLVGEGRFLEHAEYVGHFYGTPLDPVARRIERGEDVLLEIEIQGAEQVMDRVKALGWPAAFVFIAPPSLSELKRRLLVRSGELSREKLAEIARRLERAKEEIARARALDFDYLVVNDVLEDALMQLVALVRAERTRFTKNLSLLDRSLAADPVLEQELEEMERWLMEHGRTGN